MMRHIKNAVQSMIMTIMMRVSLRKNRASNAEKTGAAMYPKWILDGKLGGCEGTATLSQG